MISVFQKLQVVFSTGPNPSGLNFILIVRKGTDPAPKTWRVSIIIIIIIIKNETMHKAPEDCNLDCLLSQTRGLFILSVEIPWQLQYVHSVYAT